MKKNIRLIILLILAVLVLAAGLIVVLNLPDPQGGGNTKVSDNADLLLYDKTSLDAEEISVSNSGGDYVLVGYSYKDKVSGQESSLSFDRLRLIGTCRRIAVRTVFYFSPDTMLQHIIRVKM